MNLDELNKKVVLEQEECDPECGPVLIDAVQKHAFVGIGTQLRIYYFQPLYSCVAMEIMEHSTPFSSMPTQKSHCEKLNEYRARLAD